MNKKTLWAGRILSGLPTLFLLFDAVMKFVKLGNKVREFVGMKAE